MQLRRTNQWEASQKGKFKYVNENSQNCCAFFFTNLQTSVSENIVICHRRHVTQAWPCLVFTQVLTQVLNANTYEPLKDLSGNIAPFNVRAVVFIHLVMRPLPLLDGRKLYHNPLIKRAKQATPFRGATFTRVWCLTSGTVRYPKPSHGSRSVRGKRMLSTLGNMRGNLTKC